MLTDVFITSSIAGSITLFVEFCLSIPFIILIILDIQLAAVLLEWIMTLLFSLYLWSLVGVLGYGHLNIEEAKCLTLRRPIRSSHISLPENRPEEETPHRTSWM